MKSHRHRRQPYLREGKPERPFFSARYVGIQTKEEEKTTRASPAQLPPAVKQAVISGSLRDQGRYDPATQRFLHPSLQQALEYSKETWAPHVTRPTWAQGSGDTGGKAIEEHPSWVSEFNRKLALIQKNTPSTNLYSPDQNVAIKSKWNPNKNELWGENSTIAQRLLEAYMRHWTRQLHARGKQDPSGELQPGAIPVGVEALMERMGASETNKRAILLGDLPGEFYGWCGLAAQNGVVLGLMKKGLRFATGKPPVAMETIPAYRAISSGIENARLQLGKAQLQVDKAKANWESATYPGKPKELPTWVQKGQERVDKAFAALDEKLHNLEVFFRGEALRREVTLQGSYIAKKWMKQKADRGVGNKEAWDAPLRPGDIISPILKSSPISGHVAVVIKEEALNDSEKEEHPEAFSKVYYISGNAGTTGGGSVQVEMVYRELPGGNYNWDKAAHIGNTLTRKKTIYNQALSAYEKAQTGANLKALEVSWTNYKSYYHKSLGTDPPTSYGEKAYVPAIETLKIKDKDKTINMRVRPRRDRHMWVVSIIRTSLFNRLSGMDLSTLDEQTLNQLKKMGLEPLDDRVKSEYEEARRYWENPNGFRPKGYDRFAKPKKSY